MPPRVSTNPAIPHMFELYAFTCGAAKGLLGIVGREPKSERASPAHRYGLCHRRGRSSTCYSMRMAGNLSIH